MLNIPEEIKELLHRDSCYKNIRIHFPNGERTDICNDLIVMDSVKFTESLCSQNEFKVGICESPVFECELVGVGNIKGALIYVSCEIECPSTVTGAVFRTDIQKYVYPIPYGSFTVSECKRQADMLHRKVVAYGGDASINFDLTEKQSKKFNFLAVNNYAFTQNMFRFLVDFFDSNFLNSGYEQAETWTYGNDSSYVRSDTIAGIQRRWYWKAKKITAESSKYLYRVKTGTTLTEETRKCVVSDWFNTRVGAQARQYPGQPMTATWNNDLYPSAYGFEYVYPYLSLNPSEAETFYADPGKRNDPDFPTLWCIGVLWKYEEYDMSQWPVETLIKREQYFDPDEVKLVRIRHYGEDNPSPNSDIYLNYTWPRTKVENNYIVDYKNTDFRKLFEAYWELRGTLATYGRSDRSGNPAFNQFKEFTIRKRFKMYPSGTRYPSSSLKPQGVTGGRLLPDDYQSCWYEEEYAKPFGAVVCKYKNTSNVDVEYWHYLTGYDETSDVNTYRICEISDNNMILKNSTWTQEEITAFCEKVATGIDGVVYLPVEFVGRGLPYVEVGDTFEILTESSDIITTIVLNRTISGEQVLTDSYKSV